MKKGKIVSKSGRTIAKWDNSKMTGTQSYRLAKAKEKTAREAHKTTEAYKTARTKARATAAASAVSTSIAAQEETKRQQAKYNAQNIANQYAAIINGNQGKENAAKPEDTTGTKDYEWNPIPIN